MFLRTPRPVVLGAVQTGTVQMGHSASYYFKGKEPALVFDCSVPFGLTARQHNAWLAYGGGMELLRDVYADHPAGYESAEAWWNAIQPALKNLPGVDPPEERGHLWHFLGG